MAALKFCRLRPYWGFLGGHYKSQGREWADQGVGQLKVLGVGGGKVRIYKVGALIFCGLVPYWEFTGILAEERRPLRS
jgi:hypothetical protein